MDEIHSCEERSSAVLEAKRCRCYVAESILCSLEKLSWVHARDMPSYSSVRRNLRFGGRIDTCLDGREVPAPRAP